METGKLKVEIIRNCFIGGEPLTEGQVIELEPIVAAKLFACSSAVRFTSEEKPEKQPRETAEAKHSSKEKASR